LKTILQLAYLKNINTIDLIIFERF